MLPARRIVVAEVPSGRTSRLDADSPRLFPPTLSFSPSRARSHDEHGLLAADRRRKDHQGQLLELLHVRLAVDALGRT